MASKQLNYFSQLLFGAMPGHPVPLQTEQSAQAALELGAEWLEQHLGVSVLLPSSSPWFRLSLRGPALPHPTEGSAL